MNLPKQLTTVTPFSKALAMALFIALPFVGFYLGSTYQEKFQQTYPTNTLAAISPTPNPFTYQPTPTIYTSPVPNSWPVHPIKHSYSLETKNNTSPTGTFIIKTGGTFGDYAPISLHDSNNNILVDDIVKLNQKEIGYNKKFGCQCGTSFKGWHSNNQFVIGVVNGNGEQYEFLVSAPDGKVDESSFQRIPDVKY